MKLVMWWAHTHGEEEWISGELLRSFYREMRRALPSGGFSAYFNSLLDRRPPHIIKGREGGYQLEHRMLEGLTAKYGQREATVAVEKLLADLPSKLAKPD